MTNGTTNFRFFLYDAQSLTTSHLLSRPFSSRFNPPQVELNETSVKCLCDVPRGRGRRRIVTPLGREKGMEEGGGRREVIADRCKINSKTFVRDSQTNKWAVWHRLTSLLSERRTSFNYPYAVPHILAVTSSCSKTCPY